MNSEPVKMTKPSVILGLETSTEPVPLKIVIVGAGIAGLVAAIGLRRQGHEVHLYEQSQFADEIGAAIHISPNANSVLQKLGVDVAERGTPKLLRTRYFDSNCKLLSEVDNDAQSYRWQASWLQAHRGHLHSQLKERATSPKYPGIAARLYTSSRIVEVDVHNASITMADGSVVKGDVVVGADGVRSVTRRAVAGPEHDSFEIGKNAFRFMVPRADILADPETRDLGEAMGTMDLYFSADHKVITYPCVNNTLINIVCIHPAHQSNTKGSNETYNKGVSRETLLEIFHEFSPKLLKIFEKCELDTLKVYPLFDASTMPTFVKQRLALIGDAAHPFTPFIGQGGATAVEDAVSLGVILSRGLTRAEVPERLQLYNKARYGRATLIQGHSRLAGGDGVQAGDEKAARMTGRENALYALSHDEYDASTQALREYQWSKLTGVMWRQPTVFGPMPGLSLQTIEEGSREMRTVTTRITFKTSGTLLRNMLPSQSYSFVSKDTVALASLTIKSYRNVEWLGFYGFDRVSLEIHGISYTSAADGSVVLGRFLPIMFENSADVISAGREERGYPTVFSEIDVDTAILSPGSSIHVNLSWKGVQWGQIWLEDLTLAPTHEHNSIREAVFVHRHVPATTGWQPAGKEGDDDVQQDLKIIEGLEMTEDTVNGGHDNLKANGANTSLQTPTRTFTSSNAGFEILSRTESELPTLHHIISRLGELPIFEIVSATVQEMEGPEKGVNVSRIGSTEVASVIEI